MSTNTSQRLSQKSPARYGSYLSLLLGLVMLGTALVMLFEGKDYPMPFKLAFLISGLLQLIIGRLTLKRSRVAWAFALSLNGTLAVAFLFGAPRVRDTFEVAFGLGLAPAVIFALATVLLALGSDDF